MALLQSTNPSIFIAKVHVQPQKHLQNDSHSKNTGVLFTFLVHQYGGVATVVMDLVTWVKTIYTCFWTFQFQLKWNPALRLPRHYDHIFCAPNKWNIQSFPFFFNVINPITPLSWLHFYCAKMIVSTGVLLYMYMIVLNLIFNISL